MVKICDSAIKKPLSPIHKILLKQVYICSNAWKKVQHCPIKQIVNNNRPGSLLPIFVKFLRKSYLIPLLDTFKRIVFSVIANQVFNLIHVSINSITLTEYGMKGSSTKWKLNLRYASKIVAKTFFKTDHWVLLHGHCSSWAPVFTGVPQGSLLGPFFLIYINDLLTKGYFINQLFADDTSNFFIVNDIDISEHELNIDLRKKSLCAYQWKMSFNPDISKQAHKVIYIL